MKLKLLLLSAAFVFASAVSAKSAVPVVKADPEAFADQKSAVVQEIEQGEHFKEISDADKAEVFAALDRMAAIMNGRTSLEGIDQADRVKLINDQELVNALLTKANKDSRIQCKREKRVGSHRTTNTCRTVAEWRRASEQSREDIEKRRSLGDILPQEKPGRGGGM
jgi:hypothetical protein